MPTSISTQNRFSSWAAIPLRLIVGYGFIEHGFAKLLRGPESFTDILHAIGIPAASLMAWATIGAARFHMASDLRSSSPSPLYACTLSSIARWLIDGVTVSRCRIEPLIWNPPVIPNPTDT